MGLISPSKDGGNPHPYIKGRLVFTPSKASGVRIEFKLRQHLYGKPIYHLIH